MRLASTCFILLLAVLAFHLEAARLSRSKLLRGITHQTNFDEDRFIEKRRYHNTSDDPEWCKDCKFINDHRVTYIPLSSEEIQEMQSHTDQRTENIVQMLDDFGVDTTLEKENRVNSQIKESLDLLNMYDKIKAKMMDVLQKSGIKVRLPSEERAAVSRDALGRRWDQAEIDDGIDALYAKFNKEIKDKNKNNKPETLSTDPRTCLLVQKKILKMKKSLQIRRPKS